MRRVSVALLAVIVVAVLLDEGASAAVGGFDDVSGDAYYADAVENLAGRGVFDGTGCGDGASFCPSEPIRRWEMAVWIVRVVDGREPDQRGASRFGDVDAAVWWSAYVERMYELGVTTGCGDGANFCPSEAVKRSQMAVFLTRAFRLPGADPSGFSDVDEGAWYAAAVSSVLRAGITTGCGDGTNFCPQRRTSRGQMAVFLDRAIGESGTSGGNGPLTACRFVDHSARVTGATWQVHTGDSIGTAFYLGNDEWITAEHVVTGESEVKLVLAGQEIVATVEAVDAGVDLALLRSWNTDGVKVVVLGDVGEVPPGGDLYVVGYPEYVAYSPAVSRGVLSRLEQWIVEHGEWSLRSMILTDAASNPGNSGGPVVDACGNVVGVLVSGRRDSEGLNYAVSSTTMESFLEAARAGRLGAGVAERKPEPEPGRNEPGSTGGWEWSEGEFARGEYVAVRTCVQMDDGRWMCMRVQCVANSDLDVYVTLQEMEVVREGYLEYRFGNQVSPVGSYGSVGLTTKTAVFLPRDANNVFISDLHADTSGYLWVSVWDYDDREHVWQGQGKLDVSAGGGYVYDVLDACGY